MGEDKDFLRRWSRLKRESGGTAVQKPEAPSEGRALPSVDSLTFESDFKEFMHSKVEESVKRAALKKLFADPRFNVMDGLDTYIDDYTKSEPISDELLARLDHARETLLGPARREKEAQEEKLRKQEQTEPTQEPAKTAKADDDPGQDPKAL